MCLMKNNINVFDGKDCNVHTFYAVTEDIQLRKQPSSNVQENIVKRFLKISRKNPRQSSFVVRLKAISRQLY